MSKAQLFTVAASAALALAGSASAGGLSIAYSGLYGYDTFAISGTIAGYGAYSNSAVTGGEFGLITSDGSLVYGFCDDLFRTIPAGSGYPTPVNITYSVSPLTTAPLPTGGNALTSQQIANITGLASEGVAIGNAVPNNWQYALPAIQAAIWHDEYGVDATFNDGQGAGVGAIETAFYDTYIGQTFSGGQGYALTGLQVDQGAVQGLVTVPEPAAWAVMLLGFGAVGAMARRRRTALAAA